jgi:hypothetical protein
MAVRKIAKEEEEAPPRRGRPPAEAKKIRFQVMLDPRYLKHFKKVAKDKRIPVQDLARFALAALVPDPFNPMSGPSDLLRELRSGGK